MDFLPPALAAMGQFRQFICYTLVPSKTEPGKMTKLPVDHRTGRIPKKGDGGAFDESIWTDHETAIAAAKRFGPKYGVGFIITKAAGFWFLDIDNCLETNPETGAQNWSALSISLVNALPGAAIEVSSSRRGLHLFGRGTVPEHAVKNIAFGLEFYSDKRFVAFGKDGASGDATADLTEQLPAILNLYFPPKPVDPSAQVEWTDKPCEGSNPIPDDDALIAAACAARPAARDARAAFAPDGAEVVTKATFADLWNANEAALTLAFPEKGGGANDRAYGRSEADGALAMRLAYWTGKDCARIERLMRRSALVREKYDAHDSYLSRTILGACSKCTSVYGQAKQPVDGAPAAAVVGGSKRGAQLWPAEQLDFFKGCVYVSDAHKILVPGGDMLKPDQFRARYSGRMFVMDHANERCVRDPYEAFLESQVNEPAIADSTCFRPDLPPASVVDESGRKLANTYWPYDAPRIKGDPSRFLNHMAKLLPIERDRTILLSYMAAVVQYKGVKFQWAPLIQGAPGNGKTLFTLCVEQAVGEHYSFLPPANEISEKFNSWLFGKILIGVEDIFVQNDKVELYEVLKPMITAKRLARRAMNTDQAMQNLTANFMFNSNHKDGLRKTSDDRRVAVFYSNQQTAEDIVRDGMGGDYFPSLYAWLRNGGFAIVTELLHTFPIPDEFNPATACHRAPETSSTNAAITVGLGAIEQEVDEAVSSGQQGFCGGWISAHYLDVLLSDKRKHLARNKRDDMLATMGYVPHPHLPGGRVNNPVMPDGKKSRLYVRKDHPAYHLEGPTVIASAYTSAQMAHVGFNAPLPQGVK